MWNFNIQRVPVSGMSRVGISSYSVTYMLFSSSLPTRFNILLFGVLETLVLCDFGGKTPTRISHTLMQPGVEIDSGSSFLHHFVFVPGFALVWAQLSTVRSLVCRRKSLFSFPLPSSLFPLFFCLVSLARRVARPRRTISTSVPRKGKKKVYSS